MSKRNVKRVLVMLDYGDDDPESGEVFDLTQLAAEVGEKTEHRQAMITLRVGVSSDYSSNERPWPLKAYLEWQVMANYHSSGETGHLDDAINSSMPDSFATDELRKKLRKVQNKAEKLSEDIKIQRLRDAALIRYQHPIARVKETALLSVSESIT